MKNYTLLLIMLLVSSGLSAKNNIVSKEKFQEIQEKFSVINQLIAKLNNLPNSNGSKLVLKSATATEKLDSTVNLVLNSETQLWQKDYKDEYLYDNEMKSTTWVENEWNLTTNTWDESSKTELGHDESGRINSMLIYEKDEHSLTLKQVSKFLIFYNSEGIPDSLYMYSSEDNGLNWVLDMQQYNYHNEANQLIKTEFWVWDEDLGELTLSMNIVKTYTASGKILTSTTNYIFEGEEFPWSKIEYNYDGSERLTSTTYFMLDLIMTGALEIVSRNTYQYNESGKVSVDIYSTWNVTLVDENKTEYEYNAAGDVSEEIFSTWNGTDWNDEWKYEYTYGTTNFSEVLYPQFEFILTVYSSFLNLFGIQESFDFSYNKVIAGVNSFEMIDDSWKNTEKTTFYYSGGTSTNIKEFENTVVSVYPNPATESVTFLWNDNYSVLDLKIYQVTGLQVLTQKSLSGKPVPVSNLENGIYFYKLNNGNQTVYSGKLIKK